MQRLAIVTAVVCLFFAGSISGADAAKPAIQVIDLGDFKGEMPKGSWDKPTTISSADELGKAISDKKLQAKITKDVNFKEQKLLFFAWSGSSGDKLSHKMDGDKVVFSYAPGMTDDVKQHFQMFAVPAKAKVEFKK